MLKNGYYINDYFKPIFTQNLSWFYFRNTSSESNQHKLAVSLANSADLRVILSVLYTIVETLRVSADDDSEAYTQLRQSFKEELAEVCCF